MKELLGKIRRKPAINRFVRNFLRTIAYDERLKRFFSNRWRIAGQHSLACGTTKFRYYANADDLIADQLFYNVYDESFELDLLKKVIDGKHLFVDVGANTGLYSIVASIVNPALKTYAFEPYPANANRLQQNLALNNLDRVAVIKSAVGSSTGEIEFFIPASGDRISQTSSANEQFSRSHRQNDVVDYRKTIVPLETLDNFFLEKISEKVDVIKIDVESFEIHVLMGCKNLLIAQRPVVFCEFAPNTETNGFLVPFLAEIDYYLYAILPEGLRRVTGIFKSKGRNYLLVPAEAPSYE